MGRQHVRRSGQRHQDAADAAGAGSKACPPGCQGRGGRGGQRLQRRAARQPHGLHLGAQSRSASLATDRTSTARTPASSRGFSGVTAIAASGEPRRGGERRPAPSGSGVATSVRRPNQSARPVEPRTLTGVVAVFAGGDNTFALKADGTLWAIRQPGPTVASATAAMPTARRRCRSRARATGALSRTYRRSQRVTRCRWRSSPIGSLVGWGKNDRGQLGLGHMSVVPAGDQADARRRRAEWPTPLPAPATTRGCQGPHVRGRQQRSAARLASATRSRRGPKDRAGPRGGHRGGGDANRVARLARRRRRCCPGALPTASAALASIADAARGAGACRADYVAIAGGSQTAVAVRDDGAVFAWGASVPGSSVTPVVSPGRDRRASRTPRRRERRPRRHRR